MSLHILAARRSCASTFRYATSLPHAAKIVSPPSYKTAYLRSYTRATCASMHTSARLHQSSTSAALPTGAKSIPASEQHSILAAQRRKRPISPHLSIYKPQVTWYLSALNRITGSIVSGGFYAFGAAYVFAPLVGWHIESAHLAELFGNLGPVTRFGLKFIVAMPFTFHSFNGVRHLVWDLGKDLGNKQVIRSGWLVIVLSVVSSGGLAYYGTFKD